MSIELPKEPSRELLYREVSQSIESQVAYFHQMQESQPIHYRPEYNMWEVFRYKDVQQVLLDYATFTIENTIPEPFPGALSKNDPPEHRRRRSLVSKAFTPRRIEGLIPHFEQITDELLEPAGALQKMEVVTGLTYQLPVRVIAEMLGLPLEDRQRFLQWSYQLLGLFVGVGKSDNTELLHYFSELLNERKRDPRDDLMSALLASEENGAHLTREEIIDMCLELMFGGNITTTLLLNYLLIRCCEHPEIYQALRTDPSLIPSTIEETLRYDYAPLSNWRIARHDTVLHGHEIKAGQYVAAWVGAANFDKTQFAHPEQFDMRRSPNPHLSFGYGIHTCIGYPLARLEARIALERITARFSEIRLDPDNPVQFMDQMGAGRMPKSISILFTPAVP